MTLLALATLAAAISRPSVIRAASSSAWEELPSPRRVVFLVACLGRGEMTNWSSPTLELSSLEGSSRDPHLLATLLIGICTKYFKLLRRKQRGKRMEHIERDAQPDIDRLD
jgi:hypothetical protein